MNNIWELIMYTISVSTVAVVLLFVKWIFKDKLSPRWQYGIWSILAVAVAVPGIFGKSLLPSLQLWVETLKTTVEKTLTSSYTDAYYPLSYRISLSSFLESPKSATDWIFAVYCLGVIILLCYYLISYIKLRRFLTKHGRTTDSIFLGEKVCRVVEVEGLPSPFVCGIMNPVMAIPAGKEIDEKIVLHEMMHIKYMDPLQNVCWTIMRAIHWFNPFLQYVFNRIGNDMESLCDQRVLERLDGEELRDYGRILLDMATDKYARMAGTSSISNGGKNIARRIESIVRFKKYPKGMGLVSVCIGIVLACNLVASPAVTTDVYAYDTGELDKSMAYIRINRCTTQAAALDYYAQALIMGNSLYYGTVRPFNEHEKIADNIEEASWMGYDPVEYRLNDYAVYNLLEREDGSYTAVISFEAERWPGNGDMEYMVMNLPVTLTYQQGWCVDAGKWQYEVVPEGSDWNGWEHGMVVPTAASYEGHGKTGTFTAEYKVEFQLEKKGYNVMDCNKQFSYVMRDVAIRMDTNDSTEDFNPEHMVRVQYWEVDSEDEEVDFPDFGDTIAFYDEDEVSNGSMSSSDGLGWMTQTVIDDWDGILTTGGGTGTSWGDYPELIEEFMTVPGGFKVSVISDFERVDEFYAGKVDE